MKLFLVLLGLGGVGWGIARASSLKVDEMSEGWLTEQEARDAITRGQSDNVTIRFPIKNARHDAA